MIFRPSWSEFARPKMRLSSRHESFDMLQLRCYLTWQLPSLIKAREPVWPKINLGNQQRLHLAKKKLRNPCGRTPPMKSTPNRPTATFNVENTWSSFNIQAKTSPLLRMSPNIIQLTHCFFLLLHAASRVICLAKRLEMPLVRKYDHFKRSLHDVWSICSLKCWTSEGSFWSVSLYAIDRHILCLRDTRHVILICLEF